MHNYSFFFLNFSSSMYTSEISLHLQPKGVGYHVGHFSYKITMVIETLHIHFFVVFNLPHLKISSLKSLVHLAFPSVNHKKSQRPRT